jgi:rhodanese-related sulfurtransferase
MDDLTQISAEDARMLLERNAVLVDVREPVEIASERIPGAIALPLSALGAGETLDLPEDKTPIFFCRSGNRTRVYAAMLAEAAGKPAYAIDGGIIEWKSVGFETER